MSEKASPGNPSTDGLPRCQWAQTDPLMRHYHDHEWGVPCHDDNALFERLILELFQAGLSWRTVLAKREAFRRAFVDFEIDAVANFTETDVERLLQDAGIIRNRAKILAAVANARAVRRLVAEHGSFDAWVWAQAGQTVDAIAKTYRKVFTFMGPTIVRAFLQSVGVIDDHEPGCFRRVIGSGSGVRGSTGGTEISISIDAGGSAGADPPGVSGGLSGVETGLSPGPGRPPGGPKKE